MFKEQQWSQCGWMGATEGHSGAEKSREAVGARFCTAFWVIVRTLAFTLIEMRSDCGVLNRGVT